MFNLTRRALLAGLAALPALAADEKVKQYTADELKEALKKEQNVFFLDVREPKELQETGTIKGYVNIPIGQLESRLKEVPKDKSIITACAHGVRASKAAAILTKNGYKVIGACGLADWKAKNYPVVYPK